ncbi:hypothetical protein IAU60_003727 [Kwoniella sp. DSM 27419]
MRIAVTGAAGVVGRTVVQYALEKGHTIVALDLLAPDGPLTQPTAPDYDRYAYQQVSALDFDAYMAAVRGCQGIVHLAMIPNGPDLDERGPPPTGGGRPQYEVHNTNVAMSYNTLAIAAQLGIDRVALASSVNAVGMLFSQHPKFDYLPMDEAHPCRPEDAYSLSKLASEEQAAAMVRRHPSMRVACLRFHGVFTQDKVNKEYLLSFGGSWKDLWGWVSDRAVARSCLLALTAPTDTFPSGSSEAFFIVAPSITGNHSTVDLVQQHFPELVKTFGAGNIDLDDKFKGRTSLYDCSKARRMLDWYESEDPWAVERNT